MNEHYINWPCIGAISIDERNLLVFWKCTWLSVEEYHSLRQQGHRGWLVYAQEQDQLLIGWEPTLERKSMQLCPSALLMDPIVEVRRGRPGLLGYVAANYLPGSGGDQRLAFLAYWTVAPMTKGYFFHLQEAFSSHRGHIIHTEQDRVWIQWEPTWVYYDDLTKKKRESYAQLCHDSEALLRRFHKTVVIYSSRLAVQKRLG